MKKLQVALKQHTPLIHFQHYQDGATLRASEVKPQLDRFILTVLGNGDYEKGKCIAGNKGWLKGEHPALNYRMTIVPGKNVNVLVDDINTPSKDRDGSLRRNNKGKIKLNPYPAFFANMDTDYESPEEYRRFSMVERLDMTLYFPDKIDLSSSLYRYISESNALSRFFLLHNFGMRASKGFGSFYIAEEDDLYVTPQALSDYTNYEFQVCQKEDTAYNRKPVKKKDEYQNLFRIIELFYKSLRGGINEKSKSGETQFYFKSLSYKYCTDVLQKKWDKRAIKEFFYHVPAESALPNCDIKDVWGFSTVEQWKNQNDTLKKNIAAPGDVPTRMQSPLLFKPLRRDDGTFDVYLLFKEKQVDLKRFLSYRHVRVTSAKRHNHMNLDLPETFALADFFDYVFKKLRIDVATYVDSRFHEHAYYSILEDIFEQLK